MDAKTVAEVIEGMAVPDWDRVYVLGSLDRRVTIASQQVRALNLAAALVDKGVCRPGDHAVVVGAGVAGLTCAVGLDRLGVAVTVLESKPQILPIFRGGSSRWLHPAVYDWPDPIWRSEESPVPIMRWSAGRVPDVRAQLEAAWVRERGEIDLRVSVDDVIVGAALHGNERIVSWNPGGEHRSASAVVLAVGFGLEKQGLLGEARYWEGDDLDGDQIDGEERRWLVSGFGDGALTDLLRLCIRDFQHEEVVDTFASDPRMEPVEAQLVAAESDPALSREALHEVYASISAPWVRTLLEQRRRPATQATLVAPVDVFLAGSASPLNRFLVGQLKQIKAFALVDGRIDRVVATKGGYLVHFDGAAVPPRPCDRVVRRHGPTSALDASFPAISRALEPMALMRVHAPITTDVTRFRRWDEGVFGPEAALPSARPRARGAAFRAVIVAADDVAPWIEGVDDALTRAGGAVEVIRTGTTAERRQKVVSADVVVVVLGHRLGLVHEADGARQSVIAMTLEQAAAAAVPVVAAVVDESAAWSQPREEAALGRPGTDTAELIWRVETLRSLKRSLDAPIRFGAGSGVSRPASLGKAVAQRVHARISGSVAPARRTWRPRFEHPLQPAPVFLGREVLMSRLRDWWADPAAIDRVVALVAIGGAGKTAIAEALVSHMVEQPSGGGLFVWSFYENERVEDFLDAACAYFTGETVADPGARLGSLKAVLAAGDPHLLVLDGLERVQDDATPGRARGHLRNTSLRQLLQSLAGGLGRTRGLVTSRFELSDLQGWNRAGYRAEAIDDLDPAAARGVLRGWRVTGDDEVLDELADRVGYHALSVSVLGSYIANVGGGDPAVADAIDLDEAGQLDPQANRLARLIVAYAEAMSEAERQVMARLSILREGLTLELLTDLVSDERVAGRLVHRDQADLAFHLASLVQRGLVFRYRSGDAITFTAHPFVRDAFAALVDIPAADIHAAMADRLSSGLSGRPRSRVMDTEGLALCESLMEHLVGAGELQQAAEIFKQRIGEYNGLRELGEFERCIRMASLFPLGPDSPLTPIDVGNMHSCIGLAMGSIGDLVGAESSLRRAEATRRSTPYLGLDLMNLAEVVRSQGRLEEAKVLAQDCLDAYRETGDDDDIAMGWGCVGFVEVLLGEVTHGVEALATAEESGDDAPLSRYERAVVDLLLGHWARARRDGRDLQEVCRAEGQGRVAARVENLLGVLFYEDPAIAAGHLAAARRWAADTGDMEVALDAHRLAALLAASGGDVVAAEAELAEAMSVADANAWGLHSIGIRLDRAALQIDRRDYGTAQRDIAEALDRAGHPGCGYRWGTARGHHLMARCLIGIGDVGRATAQLEHALAIREEIGDPNVLATAVLLSEVRGTAPD